MKGPLLFETLLGDAFGKKPTVPPLKPLTLAEEQAQAVANNQAILPAAEKLTADHNAFTLDQITQALERFFPGWGDTAATLSGNIASEAKGEIPTDVSAAIKRSSAADALTGGFAGSGAARNLEARDLGLTSLNLTDKALTSAESWMKTSASLFEPAMMRVDSMFVTPMQQTAFDVNERDTQFQRQWMINQIKAMPDPKAAGIVGMLGDARGTAQKYPGSGSGNALHDNIGTNTPDTFDYGGYNTNYDMSAGEPSFDPSAGGGAVDYGAGASAAGDYGAGFGAADAALA